jgi:hypothetical protein
MSDGTSLEDIESGNVAFTADTAAMNAILSDMNAVEEAPVYTPPPPPPAPEFHAPQQPQHYQPEPAFPTQLPMFPQMQIHEMAYPQAPQPTYEKVEAPVPQSTKKNSWSLLFDDMRDPIVVGLLVTLFSLPALHTWLAKRLTWAYKVGGSLSWIGFLLQFAIVAGLFVTYRQIMKVADGST